MNRNEAREQAAAHGYSANFAAFDDGGVTIPVALSWHGPTWGTHGTVADLTWQQVSELIDAYPDERIATQARRDVNDWRSGMHWVPYHYNMPGLCKVVGDYVEQPKAATA
jgi:hypothetical protein